MGADPRTIHHLLCSKSEEMITDLTDRLCLCNSEEAMDQLEALKTFKF